MAIISKSESHTVIDADGNVTKDIKESTTNIQRNTEPDYIKLYTRMWCEFNAIPQAYRALFLELVTRMTYCTTADLQGSQLVNTGKPWSDSIMAALGWTSKAMYQKGLKALCDCEAIRKVGRGVYQINPNYAGKGEWKYNPRLDRGGVEDLVATFDFRAGTVNTSVVWADDGTDTDLNKTYRKGLGVHKGETTTLKQTRTKTKPDKTKDLPPIEEPLPF